MPGSRAFPIQRRSLDQVILMGTVINQGLRIHKGKTYRNKRKNIQISSRMQGRDPFCCYTFRVMGYFPTTIVVIKLKILSRWREAHVHLRSRVSTDIVSETFCCLFLVPNTIGGQGRKWRLDWENQTPPCSPIHACDCMWWKLKFFLEDLECPHVDGRYLHGHGMMEN